MRHIFRFLGRAAGSGIWIIDESSEVEHLQRVLRIQVGARIEVFDGRGAFACGEVTATSKNRVEVQVSQAFQEPPVASRLTIAIGSVKPTDMDDIIPDLTELGADEIHVFCQAGNDPRRLAPRVLDRWHRIILAAAKQCKRNWLPGIHTHTNIRQFTASAKIPAGRRYFGDPKAGRSLDGEELRDMGAILVVGSERGLTDNEIDVLQVAGFEPVRFGRNVLRARTAAVAGMAIMAAKRG